MAFAPDSDLCITLSSQLPFISAITTAVHIELQIYQHYYIVNLYKFLTKLDI